LQPAAKTNPLQATRYQLLA